MNATIARRREMIERLESPFFPSLSFSLGVFASRRSIKSCFRRLCASGAGLLVLACFFTAGCATQRAAPSPKLVATNIDEKLATSEYWFNRPAIDCVKAADYDTLWNICTKVAIDAFFTVERTDYRNGFISTKPMASKQFFEFWRSDVVDFHSQLACDLATHRRVVHFTIFRQPDGCYVCEPKVVVEHYSEIERRITAVNQYQDAFSVSRQVENETTEEGTAVRISYWYAERRDDALERSLANRIRGYLRSASTTSNSRGT